MLARAVPSRPCRLAATVLAALLAAACTTEIDEATRATPIGDFRLEHLVVVVDDPFVGPVSREVDDALVDAVLTGALRARLGRFDGAGTYSVGVKVTGYVLAPRAVPVLFAPRSQLFLNVILYDAQARRINAEPLQLVVNERAGGDTVIGSGYSQSAEEQLAELAENAAIEIERWLRANPQWFAPAAAPDTADQDAGAVAESARSGA